MRKNDAGLTILEKGDVVRIGKGKVEYSVFSDETGTGTVDVQSHNTGKVQTVATERLVLIWAVQDVAYEAGCDVEELNLPDQTPEGTKPVSDEAWGAGPDVPGVDEVTEESTSYQKAILFALNRLGKHVYGGTVTSKRNRRKVAKQARRNARRAGKARFLEISNAEQAR